VTRNSRIHEEVDSLLEVHLQNLGRSLSSPSTCRSWFPGPYGPPVSAAPHLRELLACWQEFCNFGIDGSLDGQSQSSSSVHLDPLILHILQEVLNENANFVPSWKTAENDEEFVEVESGEVGWKVKDLRKDGNDVGPLAEADHSVQGRENERELEVLRCVRELVEDEVECQARIARVEYSICDEVHHEPSWRTGWAHPALVDIN